MGGYMNYELFRNNICEYSLTLLNKKYEVNRCGPDKFDNNSFVWYVFNLLFNIDVNNYKEINSIDSINKIDKGSVLFFNKENNSRYMGIFLGDNKFIHASDKDERVIVSNLDEYWSNIFSGYIDILKSTSC